MKAKDFLLEQYGITLSNEKAIIHPAMLEKAMNEYAMHQCQELLSNQNNKPFIIPDVSVSVCESPKDYICNVNDNGICGLPTSCVYKHTER